MRLDVCSMMHKLVSMQVYKVQGAGSNVGKRFYVRKSCAERAARQWNEKVLTGFVAVDASVLASVAEYQLSKTGEYIPEPKTEMVFVDAGS